MAYGQVVAAALPELEELWNEISMLVSAHTALATGVGKDEGADGEEEAVHAEKQTDRCTREDKAFSTEHVQKETDLQAQKLAALLRIQHMHSVQNEFKEAALEQQQKILALEVELHELADALKTSDVALETVREERDVLGDEMAFLHARLLRLERDKVDLCADAEETSIKHSIAISDLADLIHRVRHAHSTSYEASRVDVDGRGGDVESLKQLCTTLVQEMKQRLSGDHVATLDRTRFDIIMSKNMEMVTWLLQQGQTSGFVEQDLREIHEWREDLGAASALVERTVEELLGEWQRVRAHECAQVLKRRQRTLQVLLARLDGSTAPRHKVKALKATISEFLSVDGGVHSPSKSHRNAKALRYLDHVDCVWEFSNFAHRACIRPQIFQNVLCIDFITGISCTLLADRHDNL